MRVGSLVYATDQGLGVLAKAFFDHGVITHPLVVAHGRRPEHDDWFPGAPRVTSLRDPAQQRLMRDWAASLDVLLGLETFFEWPLVDHCRRCGVKTALMVMYECSPRQLPAEPDLILCPSELDLRYYPDGLHIPVPVEVPWTRRQRVELFVHNAGHGGLKGRNGTAEVIQAWKHVRSPARLLLRAQSAGPLPPDVYDGGRVTVQGEVPYGELFATGDAFLFPERHNGLSLPLQEARAAGMLVMCGDRFPMNVWLPRDPLIPVKEYRRACVSPRCNEFFQATFDPVEIAAKVDEWYGADVSAYSEAGREWAETMSWERLGPRYLEALGGL